MTTLFFDFEELPLVISDGIQAAFINGQAEIEYSRAGGWQINSVSVEGFGSRINGKREWPLVPAPKALADIIQARLESEWFGKVQNEVNEQIAEDRECAADNSADMRRDRLMVL